MGRGWGRRRDGWSVPFQARPFCLPTRAEVHSPAHRDGKVEHAEHPTPLVCHEEVSDEGGCDGGVTGLPDPHQAPGQEEQPESLGNEIWGRWHPALQPASQPPSPAGSGEAAGVAGEVWVSESNRPELESWLHYLLAVTLRKQLNLSEPQFPHLQKGDNNNLFTYLL